MDKKQTLWGALKLRSDLAQTAILPADKVRATGALLGFDDAGLLAVVTRLSEENLVRLHWGGNVEVLEPKTEAARTLVQNFHGAVGAVGEKAGWGASFDLRGGGQGGSFNEAGGAEAAKLETIVGLLVAAAAELRARAAALPSGEAAQVEAVAEEAGNAAREAQEDAADKPGLIALLNVVTAGAEALGKLQAAAEKLGPTLTLLKTGAAAALGYFAASG